MRKAASAPQANELEQIPNVGPAIAADFRAIGVSLPAELVGKNPYELFDHLCAKTGSQHDPCVIDTFISAVRFMEGGAPVPWWHYTAERKREMQQQSARQALKTADAPPGR